MPDHAPVHQAALWQKTLDVVGDGPDFLQPPTKNKKGISNKQKKLNDDVQKWWKSLGEEYTTNEILRSVWKDYETIGFGALEIARNNAGDVGRLYYIPAHTLRFHMDGHRVAQMRNGRFIWFKRWGDPIAAQHDYYAEGGAQASPGEVLTNDEKANEVLILRSPSNQSSWYGIPEYTAGIGWVALAAAARDWNLLFFENQREPRHLIIITGLPDDVTRVADDLEEVMKTALKEPHRNVLIPIGGGDNAKVTIEKLSVDNEGQFFKLIETADAQILGAHRMPPDRIGIVRRNSMIGGSTSQIINVENHLYKLGVVVRGQNILSDRLEKFTEVEYFKHKIDEGVAGDVQVNFEDLDIIDEAADANVVSLLVKNCVISINEGRIRLGEDPDPKFKDMTYMEFMISIGVIPTEAAGAGMGIPGGLHTNTNNPKMPNPAQQVAGEPERGRPARPGNVHNPADEVAKSVDYSEYFNYIQSRLDDQDELIDELINKK